MHVQTTMRCHFTPVKMGLIKITTIVDKEVENLEIYQANGNVDGAANLENAWSFPYLA